ncbi:uncharacterized protein JCM6883_003242 [Sporobolomyces salmoneus]|uniref:uncharacterized protein n=1 Tax=Sporobolomyces salmoneus TaxID=183962 RepID=UPI0031814F98
MAVALEKKGLENREEFGKMWDDPIERQELIEQTVACIQVPDDAETENDVGEGHGSEVEKIAKKKKIKSKEKKIKSREKKRPILASTSDTASAVPLSSILPSRSPVSEVENEIPCSEAEAEDAGDTSQSTVGLTIRTNLPNTSITVSTAPRPTSQADAFNPKETVMDDNCLKHVAYVLARFALLSPAEREATPATKAVQAMIDLNATAKRSKKK